MTFELTAGLLTGDPTIDEQHRELFARVAALLGASGERSRAEVARLLDYVGDYVVEHFGAEERAMEAAGYPDLAAHRAEHQRFVQEFAALRQEFAADGPGPLFVVRVENRVNAWFREHIYRTDRALAAFLRDHRT